MKLVNIPFLFITSSIATGILIGYYLSLDIKTILISLSISILLLFISWQRAKKIFRKGLFFNLISIFIFVIFGISLVKIHNPQHLSDHYSNNSISENFNKHPNGINFHIKERLKSTSYYHKYIVSLKHINGYNTQGNILLKVPRDSTGTVLDIGNTYSSLATLMPIPKPLNPNQFDYARYLSRTYVFHKITVSKNQLIKNKSIEWSVFRLADQIRKHINYKLLEHSFSTKQLAIINALLLGQRQEIDRNTFADYRDAGAIHILAVSGLHVGIILWIFNIILSPLRRFKKKGEIIKTFLAIIFLWCFAIIAGLSPSVLRAVTMFSFLAVGMLFRSKTSIFNSLFISIFILLCFQPLLLFSVGFQLSYLAVFSIVWIQPLFSKLYTPRFYVGKKLWETFTVTIAAQIGLLPITLFYFHQFPTLFFISNLIIIPVLGVILGYGILVMLLALLNILPDFIAICFGYCIDFMNFVIRGVAQQKFFLITEISFSWRMLLLLYLLTITTVIFFKKRSDKRLYLTGISAIVLVCGMIYEKSIQKNVNELIVFYNPQNTTLGIHENQELKIYSKDSLTKKTQEYLFQNYRIDKGTINTSFEKIKNIYQSKEKTIFIIDSASIYTIKGLRPDIIILSGSPKIHLNRVIKTLKPKQIIADASNYKSYIDQWEISCTQLNIPFYRIDKKGAFILKY